MQNANNLESLDKLNNLKNYLSYPQLQDPTDQKILEHITKILLLLQSIPDLGCVKINKILKKFINLKNILDIINFDYEKLLNLGLTKQQINYILKPNWNSVDKQLLLAKLNNIEIINLYDPAYPDLLKEIYDPPVLLYIYGNKKILNTMQIGVVGTRRPTLYGKQMAEHFSNELLNYGYTITSGFAYGIDITAHLAAVNKKLPTVVVMGTSLDCVYPENHKKYINKVIDAGGVIISESAFTTAPHPSCFPRRNRIISGLSRGVLVVEAARKSGSLITARCAIEQGRDVFAIPGNINNTQVLGCLDLIADGAKLVTRAEDIIDELSGLKINYHQNTSESESKFIKLINSELSNNQQQLLAAISGGVTSFDDIVSNDNLSLAIDTIASELTQLEILGYIAAVAGGYTKNVK